MTGRVLNSKEGRQTEALSSLTLSNDEVTEQSVLEGLGTFSGQEGAEKLEGPPPSSQKGADDPGHQATTTAASGREGTRREKSAEWRRGRLVRKEGVRCR